MKKSIKSLAVGALGVSGIVVVAAIGTQKNPLELAAIDERERLTSIGVEQRRIAALPAVTVRELALAYRKEPRVADKDFRGKQFRVSGIVAAVSSSPMGEPYVSLRGGTSEFLEPQFGFDKSAARELAKLESGVEVSMMCIGKGEVARVPMADTCTLIETRPRPASARI